MKKRAHETTEERKGLKLLKTEDTKLVEKRGLELILKGEDTKYLENATTPNKLK